MSKSNAFNGKKILIADDNEMNRIILSEMLSDEFELLEATNGDEALELLEKEHANIGLVLLDIVMPGKDGYDVLQEMNQKRWIDDIQVIVISAENTALYMKRAFDLGAIDYISRPFDQSVVHRRIHNSVKLCSKQDDLQNLVTEQVMAREKNSNMMVSILSHIVEFKNGESGKHVMHINMLTEMLLKQLLTKTTRYDSVRDDISIIRMASSLHDIGKIAIPDEILNKPGKLTAEEFEIIKSHTTAGARMIQQIKNFENEPLVRYAYQICRWHHEKWDGKGYPDGLVGDDIPIAAQVVSLADVYDALTSERCYKSAYTHDEAVRMIKNNECGVFNPLLISCMEELQDQFRTNVAEDFPENDAVAKEIAKEALSQVNSRYHQENIAIVKDMVQNSSRDILFRYSAEPWVEYEYLSSSSSSSDTLTLNGAARSLLGAEKTSFEEPEATAFLQKCMGPEEYRLFTQSMIKTTPSCPGINYLTSVNTKNGKKRVRIIGEGRWGKNAAGENALQGFLLKIEPQEE